MSNLFFLYLKNGIILLGDNMTESGKISTKNWYELKDIILREIFKEIPTKTTMSKTSKKGHVLAIKKYKDAGTHICNLGTGKGYSVLEIVKMFEQVNDIAVPYKIVDRRAGDIAECWADPSKAKKELGWIAEKTLEDMCRDTWNYVKKQMNI